MVVLAVDDGDGSAQLELTPEQVEVLTNVWQA